MVNKSVSVEAHDLAELKAILKECEGKGLQVIINYKCITLHDEAQFAQGNIYNN